MAPGKNLKKQDRKRAKLQLTDDFSVHYAKEIEQIFREAVTEALRMHKFHNNPIAVWKGNKVVIIPVQRRKGADTCEGGCFPAGVKI